MRQGGPAAVSGAAIVKAGRGGAGRRRTAPWVAGLAPAAALALALGCTGRTSRAPAGGLGQPCDQGTCQAPYVCDAATNRCVAPGTRCGNGAVDPGEQCDGSSLGGQTCASLGYAGGALACKTDCTFDTSGCTSARCGNGAVDPGEQCDGANLGGQTCASLGYAGGALACKPNCTFDTSACTSGGPGTPTLVQNVSSSTNPVGIGIDGNHFKFTMPNPVLAGNALILKVAYLASASFAATPVTDDRGNAWPTSPSAAQADANGNIRLAVFVLPNAQPGLTTITIHFTASIHPVQYDCSEWTNVATASPVNGTVGSSNIASPTISAGAFTPGNNDANGGNLILYYVHTDDTAGSGRYVTTFAAGAPFTLLDADVTWYTDANSFHASAYHVQAAAASIAPSIMAPTSSGTEHFVALGIALRAARAGTAPPASGIRIVKIHHFTNEVPPTALPVQFPTTGSNLVVFVTANAPSDANTTITSIADNRSNAWAKTEPAADQPQWWIAQGATTDHNLKLTVNILPGAAGMSMRVFEIAGAATTGQPDASGGASATDCSNLSSIRGQPTITPGSANGLTIACMALGQGPGLSVSSPPGAVFDLVTYAGERDTDTMENADALAHLYNADTSTESWNWTMASLPGNTCYSSAIHLKAQ